MDRFTVPDPMADEAPEHWAGRVAAAWERWSAELLAMVEARLPMRGMGTPQEAFRHEAAP